MGRKTSTPLPSDKREISASNTAGMAFQCGCTRIGMQSPSNGQFKGDGFIASSDCWAHILRGNATKDRPTRILENPNEMQNLLSTAACKKEERKETDRLGWMDIQGLWWSARQYPILVVGQYPVWLFRLAILVLYYLSQNESKVYFLHKAFLVTGWGTWRLLSPSFTSINHSDPQLRVEWRQGRCLFNLAADCTLAVLILLIYNVNTLIIGHPHAPHPENTNVYLIRKWWS